MKAVPKKNNGSPEKTNQFPEPIAIIGIGCRLPGNVRNPEEFWQMLCNGVDAISEIPEDRWSIDSFFDPEPGIAGKSYSKWGGFIRGVDAFDAGFFGVSPREAAAMDPQQRLLLEATYEAMEDGGQTLDRFSGSNTGVFVGICTTDYAQLQSTYDDTGSFDMHTTTGGVVSIAANRISYCFNLKGPSIAVDTACSSSLVAVHLACRSMWNNECGMAIAGGVNAILSAQPFIGFSKLSMLSPDGHCKAFDASGNGFVRGEGVGVILLKPLSKALHDGDDIYAVIRGTAVNQDGRTNGITVPSEAAQSVMVQDACAMAGILPQSVQYVEAHGTGTPVGDPIEARALGNILTRELPAGEYCAIGSVKTNIGHLEAGAGIAGLIKVALCIKHRQIPPNLHFHNPNPYINFDRLKLRVQTTLGQWPRENKELVAGVNSFGFGGTNAHSLLSECPAVEDKKQALTPDRQGLASLFPFSAQSPEALRELVRNYLDFLSADGSSVSPEELGSNLAMRRSHLTHRLTVVARNRGDLTEKLGSFLAGEARQGVRISQTMGPEKPKIAFVFSGQGPQWWAMGRQLFENEPVFRQAIKECDAVFSNISPWSLIQELCADEQNSRLNETAIAQAAIFALQVGLSALWKSWGVEPDAVLGHSVGEMAAAYIAGALSLEDALRINYHRGRTMDVESAKGAMLGAGISAAEAEQLIAGFGDDISIAAINSPASVTLSGDPDALQSIAKSLEERGLFYSFLKVNYAFHSSRMDPARDELLSSLEGLKPRECSIPFVSTVLGTFVSGKSLDTAYWWQNVRKPVRFAQGINTLIDNAHTVFIEVGPHPALSNYIQECLKEKGQTGLTLPSLRRKEDERPVMLDSLGGLHGAGYPVDWKKQYSFPARLLKLPRYPWQHESYWNECATARAVRLGLSSHPLLGERLKTAYPCWSLQLNRSAFSYLEDHKVQGHIVFPATGYIEIALAVAREIYGDRVFVIEELDFLKALFIPKSGEMPVLQTTFHPDRSSFHIHARTGRADQQWTLHAAGRIRAEASTQASNVDLHLLRANLPEVTSKQSVYQTLGNSGMQYGPSFQGVDQVWRKTGESLGLVRVPTLLRDHSEEYFLHPALLDACLQVVFDTVTTNTASLFLPVHVAQLRFHQRQFDTLWSHAHLLRNEGKVLEGNLQILNRDGAVLIEIRGLRCQAIDTTSTDSSEGEKDWVYRTEWQLKPRALSAEPLRDNDYMPAGELIQQQLVSHAAKIVEWSGWKAQRNATAKQLDVLSASYIIQALNRLGWQLPQGDHVTTDSLVQKLGIVPRYQRLLQRLLGFLVEDGALIKEGDGWTVIGSLPAIDSNAAWRSVLDGFPAFYAELSLLANCGNRLAEVLQGTTNPVDLIFQNGSSVTTEHLYHGSPSFKAYNLLAAKAVATAIAKLPEERTLRILEIGAGTGGMTTGILHHLPADRTEYVFTDVSAHFLNQAEQKFRDAKFLKYQLLDIEKDPIEQGFTANTFDVILASNVLHATSDLSQSLHHLQKLLASEGLLVAIETDRPARWVDLVFGLTDGWWRFSDTDLRPAHPLLSRDQWAQLLDKTGFVYPFAVSDNSSPEETGQVVLVARGKAIIPATQQELVPTQTTTHHHWLIFADMNGLAAETAGKLNERGDTCIIVSPGELYRRIDDTHFELHPEQPEDYKQLLMDITGTSPSFGILYWWGLNNVCDEHSHAAAFGENLLSSCTTLIAFVQALASNTASFKTKLWIMTTEAAPVGTHQSGISVAQSPLVGLGRVIANEHPELCCKLVDLSCAPTTHEIDSLCDELRSEDLEDEVALRERKRYVLRLTRSTSQRQSQEISVNPLVDAVRIEINNPGVLDNLELRLVERRAPGRGEVEIRVYAASLNFRDVLKTLGIYPSDSDDRLILGDECAGVVVRVGEGVTGFTEGDRVMAVARGCLSSFVTTDASFVMPMPSGLGFEEAATIPVVFLTAYYTLHRIGRISRGERVLIHAGAGGVGLAAVQLALLAGAEALVTAGTPEKRLFLKALGAHCVMDSRTLSFAEEVMEYTHGQGVDIVLNSLAGDAIQKGLECLAPHGRFIEIGTRDIYQNSLLGLRAFKKALSFISVGPLTLTEKPAVIRSCFDEILRLFENSQLHPLPHRVFSVSETHNAFKCMAQARHTGKIIISFREENVAVIANTGETFRLRDDASYLITGGLGGFGLATAEWMAERGARTIILVGRTGVASDESKRIIAGLESKGVKVVPVRADVSHPEECARVINDIGVSLPPLRGVIHAATVYADHVLLQLNKESVRQVLWPKALGAWNLHSATRSIPLDFFAVFSSVAAITGNPGQGNYAAANAFLDALAYHRHSEDLPALSISWGYISDRGYVARNSEVSKHLEILGFKGIHSNKALDVMGQVLSGTEPHISVMDVDWQVCAAAISSRLSPRFSLLTRPDSAVGVKDARFRGVILAARPEDRPQLVMTFLTEQVARVLGTSPSKLDTARRLNEMGLDSLMMVELKNRIEQEVGASLSAVELMRGPSIEKLSAMILHTASNATPSADQPATHPPAQSGITPLEEKPEDILQTVDDLSEQEVNRLLKQLVTEEDLKSLHAVKQP